MAQAPRWNTVSFNPVKFDVGGALNDSMKAFGNVQTILDNEEKMLFEQQKLAQDQANKDRLFAHQGRVQDFVEGADGREQVKALRLRQEDADRSRELKGIGRGLSFGGAERLGPGGVDKILQQDPRFNTLTPGTPWERAVKQGLVVPGETRPDGTRADIFPQGEKLFQDFVKAEALNPATQYGRRNQFILDNPGMGVGTDPKLFGQRFQDVASQSDQNFSTAEIDADMARQITNLFPSLTKDQVDQQLDVLKATLGTGKNQIFNNFGSGRNTGSGGSYKPLFDITDRDQADGLIDQISDTRGLSDRPMTIPWLGTRIDLGKLNATKTDLRQAFGVAQLQAGVTSGTAVVSVLDVAFNDDGTIKDRYNWRTAEGEKNFVEAVQKAQAAETQFYNSKTGQAGTDSFAQNLASEAIARDQYMQSADKIIQSGSPQKLNDEQLAANFLDQIAPPPAATKTPPRQTSGAGSSGRTTQDGALFSSSNDVLSDADFENSQLLDDGQLGPLFNDGGNQNLDQDLEDLTPVQTRRGLRNLQDIPDTPAQAPTTGQASRLGTTTPAPNNRIFATPNTRKQTTIRERIGTGRTAQNFVNSLNDQERRIYEYARSSDIPQIEATRLINLIKNGQFRN